MISETLIAILLLFTLMPGGVSAAAKEPVKGTIAVFPVSQASAQLSALSQKSAEAIAEAFNRLGRFVPVEEGRVQTAIDKIPEGSGEEAVMKAATELNADLYATVTVYMMGSSIIGTVTINPVSAGYQQMKQSIAVRSMVPLNIPLKLAREVALLHKKLPVEASILEKRDGLYVLSAGQWHGIRPGRYRTDRGQTVIVRNTSRYRSLASLPDSAAKSGRLTIRDYPSVRGVIREIDDRIEYNTNYRYSLAGAEGDRNIDPEKKFTAGICLINPGANACFPGYGSYLSTSYLGFKNTTPSIAGIVFSSALIITHFLLPEYMTRFKINFFPGVMDGDKTRNLNNLQIFLWSTVPLTFSAAYLDQLSYQFTTNSVLPPFFMSKNETALVLSVIIPGGGMFYKGYRLPGWGFYLSEMFLAGFCVYTRDEKKKVVYGGIALGAVKLIELVTAAFSPPSYSFYNIEKEGRIRPASLSMGVEPAETGDLVYRLGMTFSY
ncbi:MAG: hypothetical protein A2176_11345 [Spirochaetes bacterium RBG_13_51_14]|nr:MAG: hypothetical protein A2176_11345 [Spirochaetes bacterium RBG_13_51_14]